MSVLFIFLDGVGLGIDDELTNPFSNAIMPNLITLLGGRKLVLPSAPFIGDRASLFSIDANLGVPGVPQSATGQAVILTGTNVPNLIGYHYGPKPDKATAASLLDGGIFGSLKNIEKKAALLNAYPPEYFHAINSGKRMYSSIPLSVTNAGIPLFTMDDLLNKKAISADFTGAGWFEKMGISNIPEMSKQEAGQHLISISQDYDFAFFEYWLTDYAGHGQNMESAVELLSGFDNILGGVLTGLDEDDILIITSDHGNIEDLSTRRHTNNPVPFVVVGNSDNRKYFDYISDLCGISPAILKFIQRQQ